MNLIPGSLLDQRFKEIPIEDQKPRSLTFRKVNTPLENLLNLEFKCLDKGFVRLVDYMGDESSIVQAARVSYGSGTKTVREDTQLIRFLLEHEHTTPFEMVELKFHIKIPMDAWRQMIRQRTASVNEYSTRYSEAIDDRQETSAEAWRLQSGMNKQGSEEGQIAWPSEWKTRALPAYDEVGYIGHKNLIDQWESPGHYLSDAEQDFHKQAQELYANRLEFGVSREQARKDLPLSTYTEAYWKIDMHNLLRFLAKRMDSHAQLEIRDYANIMGAIVQVGFPALWQAHCDFDTHKNAIKFSGPEQEALKIILNRKADSSIEEYALFPHVGILEMLGKRGTEAFIKKAKALIDG